MDIQKELKRLEWASDGYSERIIMMDRSVERNERSLDSSAVKERM
jgi:hypothetical protein